jgi:uncharacterized protein
LTELRIELLSTSVRIPPGWRLRLALAGADADSFAHVPEGGAPTIIVERGPDTPSRLVLPVMEGRQLHPAHSSP